MDTVTVLLTKPDAQLFKEWQQFHETFQLLVEKGVFDTKHGKVTLNFNNNVLQSIVKEETIYKRLA